MTCKHGHFDRVEPSLSNWLVRLLSFEGQVSLAVEKDYSLIKDKLASRRNFRQFERGGIPRLIEENSGSSVPALTNP